MFHFFALITDNRYWKFHSFIMVFILKCYGIHVGKGVRIRGVPRLKLKGGAKNIIIKDNVTILGDIDIRNRENGKLILEKNSTIEKGCRFVAAREGTIRIGQASVIGADAIFNGGADILIGKKCLFAVRTSINSNDHLSSKQWFIRDQGFIHAPVIIEDDCWIGTNVSINKGVTLKQGSIIGANSVVTKDTLPYSINGGGTCKKNCRKEISDAVDLL